MAVAELLWRGFDVYMTLMDDQQIGCVVRQEKGGKLRYLDIHSTRPFGHEPKRPCSWQAVLPPIGVTRALADPVAPASDTWRDK
jgi:hypothetical protein